MKLQYLRIVLACATALSLAACGGGGGVNSIPAPPPPPPPPPPTTTAGAVKIFDDINASTQFATLGLESSRGPNNILSSNGFSASYDSVAGTYVISFPSAPGGGFYQYGGSTPNSRFWSGYIGDAAGNTAAVAYVLKPSNPDLKLSYTSYLSYDQSLISPEPFGFVAFGTATAPGAMPVTGSATYDTLVDGISFDKNFYVRGSATLLFDFGAGQLSGHFDPTYASFGGLGEQYPLGRYDFTNTVYSTGSTSFSGDLAKAGAGKSGGFSGLFTGPAAQELMARWTLIYHDPQSNSDLPMFGVWVGKKH